MSEGDFHVQMLWATAERLVGLRQDLARWVAGTPLSPERQEDVVLAAYEAMANAAEHAYPDGRGGPLEITGVRATDEVTVIVADQGHWKAPDPTETVRGRGRAMMDVLADDSATVHGAAGTTVTIRFQLG